MPRLSWVVVTLSWALACGGRFQRAGEEDEGLGGSSPGAGGTASSSSGAAGRGGAPTTAGTGAATGGSFATAGTMGIGAGGACFCDPIVCPDGYRTVPSPGGCCFQCQLDVDSCERQREDYEHYRRAVLFKYSPPVCMTSADCTTYYDKNECQVYSCGVMLNVASWAAVDAELNAFARKACNPACPSPPVPPCEPTRPPTCFRGVCE